MPETCDTMQDSCVDQPGHKAFLLSIVSMSSVGTDVATTAAALQCVPVVPTDTLDVGCPRAP